jgi:hypothetical protein
MPHLCNVLLQVLGCGERARGRQWQLRGGRFQFCWGRRADLRPPSCSNGLASVRIRLTMRVPGVEIGGG